jgi:hypothetical protein
MGEALVGKAERQSPAMRPRRAVFVDANGRPFRYDAPAGHVSESDAYTPDDSVYQIDESNSPIKQFFDVAKEGRAVVEMHIVGQDADGKYVDRAVTLSEATVRDIVTGGDATLSGNAYQARLGEALSRLHEAAETQVLREVAGQQRVFDAYAEAIADGLTHVDAMASLRESFREDTYFSTYDSNSNDFGTGQSPPPADEFLPLGNGPFNQQMYLYDQWDQLAKSFWAASHDPVASAALEIIVDFVLGRGFTVVAKDPRVQKEWDAFWTLNEGDLNVATWLRDWFRDGENMTRFFPQGHRPPLITMLEPSTVLEIVTDPENIKDVKYYWQQFATAYQLYTTGDILSMKYIVRQIPPDQVIHTKLNASSWEKRGRSDLFPVLGWLKRLRDYYNAETMKAIVQAAFAWDFTIKGSGVDVATINSYASQTPTPSLTAAGQGFYHNDAVEVKPLQADKNATTSGGIGVGDGLLGIIAVGVHIAKDYLGVTSRGARATAVVAETPAVKFFESRQHFVIRPWLEKMCAKVCDIAMDEGRLERNVWEPADSKMVKAAMHALRKGDYVDAMKTLRDLLRGGRIVPLDLEIEVVFPDIVKADRTSMIADAERAESDGYFSKKRAATFVAGAFDVIDYDFEEEQDEIAEEMKIPTARVIAKTGQQVAKGLPHAGDPAWNPGEVPDQSGSGGGGDVDPDEDAATSPKSVPDHNPAGAGAAVIRKQNRGPQQESSRKTISFIVKE